MQDRGKRRLQELESMLLSKSIEIRQLQAMLNMDSEKSSSDIKEAGGS